ncbi:hypothetical protein SUGI_0687820 [Cryptomeria japonica]|nr:hypothetical protein SUGI_0687820 [Cryptomeria japonica]
MKYGGTEVNDDKIKKVTSRATSAINKSVSYITILTSAPHTIFEIFCWKANCVDITSKSCAVSRYSPLQFQPIFCMVRRNNAANHPASETCALHLGELGKVGISRLPECTILKNVAAGIFKLALLTNYNFSNFYNQTIG